MTTVVAFSFGEACVMAADSYTNVYDRPVDGAQKVIQCTTTDGGYYLLGFASEGAGPSIIRRHLTIHEMPDLRDDDSRNGWANTTAQAITELYADHLLLEQGRMDANLLLGAAGYLWTITHMQAIPHLDGLGAIGSGEGPALGALYAYLNGGMDPVEAVTEACRIGIQLDRYSGGQPLVVRLGEPREPELDRIVFV